MKAILFFLCFLQLHLYGLDFSVIIPCHRAHVLLLPQLLDCYSNQTKLPKEVVISISEVDEKANTLLEYIAAQSYPFNLKLLKTSHVLFAGENRNKACKHASYDYIAAQDADDIPHPQRIEVLDYLHSHYDFDIILHGCNHIMTEEFWKLQQHTPELKTLLTSFIQSTIKPSQLTVFPYPAKETNIEKHHGCPSFRKSLLRRHKWSSKKSGQDVEFINAIKLAGKKILVADVNLIFYCNYLTAHSEKSKHAPSSNTSHYYANLYCSEPVSHGSVGLRGIEYLKKVILDNNITQVIELGGYAGNSTLNLLSALPSDGRVYVIENWQNSFNDIPGNILRKMFYSNITHYQGSNQIIPLDMNSEEGFLSLQNEFDMVYFHPAYDYSNIEKDIEHWMKKIRHGGVICGSNWKDKRIRKIVTKIAQKLRIKNKHKTYPKYFKENRHRTYMNNLSAAYSTWWLHI